MNLRAPRRLAFELLEPKASPSALLLALAPLGEPDQRVMEDERAIYATSISSSAISSSSEANVELLKFIERNTRSHDRAGSTLPLPTAEQAAVADNMMQTTDTDLRTMLIAEMLDATSIDDANVFSVIQF